MKIGALSRLSGLAPPTIRYYESVGLIPSPPRAGNGYRDYPNDVLRRLRSIRRAQALGFTLEEIRILFELPRQRDGDCRVRQLILAKLDEVDRQAQRLSATRTALARLAAACIPGHGADCCPVLDSLDHDASRMPQVEILLRTNDPHGEVLRDLMHDACTLIGLNPCCEVIEWEHEDPDLPGELGEYLPLTVLVNGIDIGSDAVANVDGALCRLYAHGEQLRPVPPLDKLLQALGGAVG